MTIKKILLSSLMVVLVVTIVACNKAEDVVSPQSTTTTETVQSDYPIVTDEEFYSTISGLIEVPKDIELSNKVKYLIFDDYKDKLNNPNWISFRLETKMPIIYTEDDIAKIESSGQTQSEIRGKIEKELQLDLSKPLETTNRKFQISSHFGLTHVPHYYEWDTQENPNHYNWCGHAALKGVADKHGTLKSLGNIHSAFWNNSVGYQNDRCNDNKFCASLLDLVWCAKNSNNKWWNYSFPKSSLEKVNSISTFYQRIKDGVDYDKPAIVPSFYGEPYGHFFPVVGYYTVYRSNGSIDYNKSWLLLRDVQDSTPSYWGDKWAKVSDFYNKRNKNQILFVRPN